VVSSVYDAHDLVCDVGPVMRDLVIVVFIAGDGIDAGKIKYIFFSED